MSETFPFVEHFPYLGIFLLLILGTLGCPFPEDTILMLSGFLVARDVIRLIPILSVVYPTLLLTDLILYGLGRRYGRKVFEHPRCKKILSKQRLQRIEDGFKKWGIWVILLGRQLPGVRAQLFLVSGTMEMRFIRFLIADAASALITIVVLGGMGCFIGERLHVFAEDLSRIRNLTIILLLIAAVSGVLYVRRKKPVHLNPAEIANPHHGENHEKQTMR